MEQRFLFPHQFFNVPKFRNLQNIFSFESFDSMVPQVSDLQLQSQLKSGIMINGLLI